MDNDEMLRIYETPEGGTVLRFGNKCFVALTEGGDVLFVATPDDSSEWAAKAVVKKWKLKRTKTINITLEQEVEAAILTNDMGRGEARRFVAAARRMAQKAINALRDSIKVHIYRPDGEIITSYEQGRLITRKADDVLDAEFIGD